MSHRPSDAAQDSFRQFDIDANGQLDKLEVAAMLSHLGFDVSESFVQQVFAQYNKADDEFLNLDEFRPMWEFCQKNHPQTRPPEDITKPAHQVLEGIRARKTASAAHLSGPPTLTEPDPELVAAAAAAAAAGSSWVQMALPKSAAGFGIDIAENGVVQGCQAGGVGERARVPIGSRIVELGGLRVGTRAEILR